MKKKSKNWKEQCVTITKGNAKAGSVTGAIAWFASCKDFSQSEDKRYQTIQYQWPLAMGRVPWYDTMISQSLSWDWEKPLLDLAYTWKWSLIAWAPVFDVASAALPYVECNQFQCTLLIILSFLANITEYSGITGDIQSFECSLVCVIHWSSVVSSAI